MKNTTKRYIFIVLFALSLTIAFLVFGSQKSQHDNIKLETGIFKTETGWGYNILANNKIYIHQEFIPAIVGRQAFQSRDDALKTSDLLLMKMKMGKRPAISIHELDSLGVNYYTF